MESPGPSELWTVEDGQEDRLDVFLAKRLSDATRSLIRKWIDGGHVRVNARLRKAGYALRIGDEVRLSRPAPEPVHLDPEALPLQIVYEDDSLVVIDKSAGMVVHPGAGNRRGTLANALLHHLREVSREDTARPGIVHRLDKDTSGLLVVAKTESAHLDLSAQFKDRAVTKGYRALVYGRVEADGRIEVPIGRDPRHRTRMSIRTRRPRSATTEYRVVERYEGLTLLSLRLHTGRTHQIRVHLEHIGHPVVGDPVYRGNRPSIPPAKVRAAVRALGRQFLHASELAFRHPATQEAMSFESPLPSELASILSRLE